MRVKKDVPLPFSLRDKQLLRRYCVKKQSYITLKDVDELCFTEPLDISCDFFPLKPSVLSHIAFPKRALLAKPAVQTVSERQLLSLLPMQFHCNLQKSGDISQ